MLSYIKWAICHHLRFITLVNDKQEGVCKAYFRTYVVAKWPLQGE